jgi:hypothetical protein
MATPIEHGQGQPDPHLTSIGDIGISQYWIQTPNGSYPIRGSVWTVTDMTHYQERMSPTGIVLCLIFVWFCLIGLLFLLMKERSMTGYIQVTVQGTGFHYSTMVPANHSGVMVSVNQTVNYARSLAAAV